MAAPTLTLHITDADKYGFYLHTLALSEGISSLSSALLTLYSRKAVKLADLKELIYRDATVEISQTGGPRGGVTRYFTGVITSVKHCGAARKTKTETVCRYMLKIESPLALLKYGAHQRHYINHPVGDVIREILDDYNLTADVLPDDIITRKGSFYQGRSNDYEFLLRILGEYSLNYINQSSTDPLSRPLLHIFSKTPVPASEVTPAAPAGTVVFNCSGAGAGVNEHIMSSWEMSSSLGVDKVEIHYENIRGRNEQSAVSAKDSARKRVFNKAPFGVEEDEDVKDLADSLLSAFESSKDVWKGHTSSLFAMPGTAVDVKKFGRSDETIEALVTSSNLEVTASWPTELGTGSYAPPRVENAIRCCSRNTKEKSAVNIAESDINSAVCSMFRASGREYGNVELLTATVCDRAGSCDNGNWSAPLLRENDTDTYTFYAKTENDRIIAVHLTMPLGGFNQGLYRVPRVGDRILVQSNGRGSYYLSSYLPNRIDMPFADSLAFSTGTDLPDPAGMIILRHTPRGMKMAGKQYASVLTGAGGQPDTDVFKLSRNTTGSELGIYSWSPAKDKDKEEDKNNAAAANADSGTKDAAGSKVENAAKDTAGVGDTVKVLSQGKIMMSSNSAARIQGKNIFVSANPSGVKSSKNDWNIADANIKLKSFNSLKIKAETKIKFSVGDNAISIEPKGVTIRSRRWGAKGYLDSTILMTGYSGTVISGMRVRVLGFTGASIGDSLGGGVEFSGGTASVSGAKITMQANTRKKMSRKLGTIIPQLLTQFTAFMVMKVGGCQNKDVAKYIEMAGAGVTGALGTGEAFLKFKDWLSKERSADSFVNGADWVTAVANLLSSVIGQIIWVWEVINEESLDTPVKNNPDFTCRDVIRLIGWLADLAVWSLAFGVILVKMKARRSTALAMSSEKIEVEAYEEEFFGKESTGSETFVAGRAADADVDSDDEKLLDVPNNQIIRDQPL